MSVKIRKKQVALAAMVMALGAAVFINWYYTGPQSIEQGGEQTTSVSRQEENLGDAQYVGAKAHENEFAEFEIERKTAHDEAAETLNDIIKDSSSTPQAVEKASEELALLTQAIKRESDLETLIKAKTGGDCVVIIDGDDIKVITQKDILTDAVTMQIKDLILNQGEFTPENITIFEINS